MGKVDRYLFVFSTKCLCVDALNNVGTMLEFIRDGSILHTEDLCSVDPLTLETYSELLESNRFLIFCILVCNESKRVYLARNIIGMRYTVSGSVNVYKLKDPTTRNEVKDIQYFEVVNNPLFLRIAHKDIGTDNVLINEQKEDAVTEEMNITQDPDGRKQLHGIRNDREDAVCVRDDCKWDPINKEPIIRVLFIGNELDLLCSIDLQNKIFRGVEPSSSFYDAVLGGVVFLACFILLFFFIIFLFYMLLRFMLLS